MWSCIRAFLAAEVKDVEGRTRFKLKQPSRSFLRNFARVLYGAMYDDANEQVTEVVKWDGSTRSFPYLYAVGEEFMATAVGVGGLRRGIAVGNGTKEVAFGDYDLDSIIAHGTGAGQLYYNKGYLVLEEGSDYAVVKFVRSFDNQSGGIVTVTEVGLYIHHDHRNDREFRILVARDLLDPAITLAPGETLNVRYEIEIRL